MGDELLTGVNYNHIRECAQKTAAHIPTPWRAYYDNPSMSGEKFILRGPTPGIRVSGHEYNFSGVIVNYLNTCGPDVIIRLCNEIEGLHRLVDFITGGAINEWTDDSD